MSLVYTILSSSFSVYHFDSLFMWDTMDARPPCPSPSPRVCWSSCSLCQWCHPDISCSDVLFSFCLQSFPASGTFPVSWLFISGGQSIRALTLASVLPVNIQGWFPLGLTGLISLQSDGLSRVFSSTTVRKHRPSCNQWLTRVRVQKPLKSLHQHHSSKASNSPVLSFLYSPTLTSIHNYWRNHSFD